MNEPDIPQDVYSVDPEFQKQLRLRRIRDSHEKLKVITLEDELDRYRDGEEE